MFRWGVLMSALCFIGATPLPHGYVVFQAIALDPAVNGTAGTVEILQDERVTDSLRAIWGNSGAPEMMLEADDPLLAEIDREPLREGRVRVVDSANNVLLDEPLGAALGKIDVAHLYGDGFPTYLVAADFGVGVGSYAGPATTFMEVRAGKVSFLTAEGQKERLSVGSSLKNAWKIIGSEIEVVQCHPEWGQPATNDDPAFVVEYTSYRFDGKVWRRAWRQEPGYFEDDGPWPDRAKFP